MTWLGITWDEGPHFQMERMELYRREAERLLRRGKRTVRLHEEELDTRREEMVARKEKSRYDGRCRTSPRTRAGEAARFAVQGAKGGQTVCATAARDVVYENAELDDLVLLRTDGVATYNFVVVVDDASMGITMCFAATTISTTRRNRYFFMKRSAIPPAVRPLPADPRDGRRQTVETPGRRVGDAYREKGFLPEAMVNYLVRLGGGTATRRSSPWWRWRTCSPWSTSASHRRNSTSTSSFTSTPTTSKWRNRNGSRASLSPFSRNEGSTRNLPVAHRRRADLAGAFPHPRGDAETAEYYFRGSRPIRKRRRSSSHRRSPGAPRDRRGVFRPRRLLRDREDALKKVVERHGGNLKVHSRSGSPSRGNASPAVRGDGDPRRDEVVRRLRAAAGRIGA